MKSKRSRSGRLKFELRSSRPCAQSKALVAFNTARTSFEPSHRVLNHWIAKDKLRSQRYAPALRYWQVLARLRTHCELDTARFRSRYWFARLGLPSNYGDQRRLPLQTEPVVLCCDQHFADRSRRFWLTPEALAAWQQMQRQARCDGVDMRLVSAFRSVEYQAELVRKKLARGVSMDDVLFVSAAPGYSEHHTGRAIDIAELTGPVLEVSFAQTPSFAWLLDNAARFGFYLSFPETNPHQIAYEPWHWCFSAR